MIYLHNATILHPKDEIITECWMYESYVWKTYQQCFT